MSLTRAQLRQKLAQITAGAHFVQGTITAPGVNTATIAALIDNGLAGDSGWLDHYLWTTASAADDQERRIITYTYNTGVVVPHRPWGVAPLSSAAVEVHRWPPSMLNLAIDRALVRCFYWQTVTVTPVANTRLYDLSTTNTWIVSRDQYGATYWRCTDTTNNGALQRVTWAKIEQNGTTIQLRIDPPPRSTTGFDIAVWMKRPYTTLSTESATTDCPETWILAGAKLELYKLLREMASSNKERDRYVLAEREAEREFRNQSQHYQALMPQPVVAADAYYPWGSQDYRAKWV